jgi:hypothetical protein
MAFPLDMLCFIHSGSIQVNETLNCILFKSEIHATTQPSDTWNYFHLNPLLLQKIHLFPTSAKHLKRKKHMLEKPLLGAHALHFKANTTILINKF